MTLKQHADRLLATACERGQVPGVVAMATSREGLLYEGAFGERVHGSGVRMTPDTVGWIASMTKALTSVAAVQLVERGRLELDAPAASVVPEIGQLQVLAGFDDAGQPRLRSPRRAITLRHLLTHSSGCSYERWNGDIARAQRALGLPGVSSGQRQALMLPLAHDPGERWEYGVGIDWAGLMIEAVTGQTLGNWLRSQLLDPLGMTSTAFRITDGMRSRLARIHRRDDDGHWAPDPFEMPQSPEFEMGGGGLYGTMGDYLRFVRMVLNGGQLDGERVLRPESVHSLGLNHLGSSRVRLLQSVTPISCDAEFFPGVPKSWSLAFQLNHEPTPTGRAAGGLMWAGLANSYYWIDPARGLAGVYLTQIFPFADPASLSLFVAFETLVNQHQ